MKAFFVTLILCWLALSESLTCHHSSGSMVSAMVCPPSVKFCYYHKVQETLGLSYIFPTIQMSCGGGCEKYGRSTKRITVPGLDPVFMHTDEDTYCCDTDLCNTHGNFKTASQSA